MKNRQKFLWILILCIGLIIYSSYFFENQKNLAIKQFETSEKKLQKKMEQEASDNNYHSLVLSEKGKSSIILFLPTNAQKAIINDVQKDMTLLAEKSAGQLRKEVPTKIFYTVTSKRDQQNVTRYEYVQKKFQWESSEKKWSKSTKKIKEYTLINNLSGNKLTLGDIFTNQQNLLKLTRNIQEELLASAKDSKQDVEKILALPSLLATQTDFSFEKTKITIPFHQKDGYIEDYTFNYEQVGRFLNPDFVDNFYLQDEPAEEVVPKAKVVALTFDDGPSDKTTPTILTILKKKKVPATFFMLGQQAEKFPELVKAVSDDGHELANHSYSHPNLVELSAEDTRKQINQTQAAIYKATGILPKYVRPPYGSFNYDTAVAIGLPLVNWSVDSLDWKTKNSKKIIEDVTNTIGSDSIILMHDIHQETADALEKLITNLQKEGYQFVTISDLLQVTPNPLMVYYSSNDQRGITN